METPTLITVEANIAAGKTTLMSVIRENYGDICDVIEEPVELWRDNGIFQEYLKDPNKYAAIFQLYVLMTRMKIIHDIIRNPKHKKILVVERSFVFDVKCFVRANFQFGHINEQEYKTLISSYEILRDKVYKMINLGGVIYINTPLDMCISRMSTRGRDTEKDSYQYKYMELLHSFHDEAVKQCECKVLTVDGSKNYTVGGADRSEIIKKIGEFVNSY